MSVENDPELEALIRKKIKQMMKQGKDMEKEQRELIAHLDSRNFDEFIRKNKVAVVDFWAEWCAPCLILAPIIEELAMDYPQVGFGKLNSDENQDIAGRYGVMSLPTVIFFKNGEPVDEVIGAVPREELEIRLKSLLGD
ncbi:thioredoxin [Metallosphaera sedula]|uniref:Thioredoxin n=3 Tax=Metallosphaera TaxID=41980 RepID=A4YEU9_METS5|nr:MULTISPECIES: thioredoxin [Metallosphaera]ABP94951.1 thioredoxin [Metallosphaera sedula DSM 5348]AIM26937.1 thioredoxin [Metallosphaera sedula]AKV73867.1 thioredoxin [Metallosphaera sedula]AKV76109.1 thioredoxin [Metallosphaera sedula]AKV78360.1 thioredoxin [Metallosphaera sedula]